MSTVLNVHLSVSTVSFLFLFFGIRGLLEDRDGGEVLEEEEGIWEEGGRGKGVGRGQTERERGRVVLKRGAMLIWEKCKQHV